MKHNHPQAPLNRLIKRLFDIIWAAGSLILLSPVIMLSMLAVYLDDGAPVFFVQKRIGLGGKEFPFFKLRTMVRNAERMGAGYEIDAGDKRITRTGNFLRRWSLDELPQLFNVLRGEMSIVGPRPTLAYQVEAYSEHQRRRLEALPGLTGLAQVSGRNSLSWPERIELDIEYIDNYSFWLDLQIIARTFFMLGSSAGIYGRGWAKNDGDPGFGQCGKEKSSDPGNGDSDNQDSLVSGQKEVNHEQ